MQKIERCLKETNDTRYERLAPPAMRSSGLAERGRWRWDAVAPTRVVGVVVALVGALIVLGWAIDTVIVPSANPASPAIRLNTGVCLLLLGTGLALAAWGRSST